MHSKTKYVINLKPASKRLDAGDQILFSNLLKPCTLISRPENKPFPLAYSAHRVINGTGFHEFSFFVGPYYLEETMLKWQGSATAMDGLFSAY